jgi:outer membrane biosynthesis protein TonB
LLTDKTNSPKTPQKRPQPNNNKPPPTKQPQPPQNKTKKDPSATAAALSQALADARARGTFGSLASALSNAVAQGGGSAAQALAEAYAQVCDAV